MRSRRRLPAHQAAVILGLGLCAFALPLRAAPAPGDLSRLERSYWLHASLAYGSGANYWRPGPADWLDAGFGAQTLRAWIDARNRSPHPTAWDLIVVAWDYRPTQRGEYPGYDDDKKNMPLARRAETPWPPG